MRAYLLILSVVALSAVGIFSPLMGLYAYTWFSLMRPDVLAFAYGQYNFALALAGATIAGSIRYSTTNVRGLFKSPIVIASLLLQGLVALSVSTAAVSPQLCFEDWRIYVSVVVMGIMVPFLVQTERHLRIFLLLIGFSLGFIGLRFGLYGIVMGGVRYNTGHGGFFGDNNGLGLAMAMVVPLCWYCAKLVSPLWMKCGYLVLAATSFATVVQTYSRGAAISVSVSLLLIIWRAKYRAVTLLTFAVMVLLLVVLVGPAYTSRLATLGDVEEDSSAASRLVQAKVALRMALDYPLLGVGFGGANFVAIAEKYDGSRTAEGGLVVHNTYLQMLVDSGLAAFLLFAGILAGTLISLSRSGKRMKKLCPGKELYPYAIQSSLLAFAVGCTFYSRIKFEPYYSLLFAAAAWRLVEFELLRSLQQQSPAEVPVAPAPAIPATVAPAPIVSPRRARAGRNAQI